MRINLSVLLLLLTLWSCAEKRSVNDKEATSLDDFKSYHLDLNLPKESFVDMIESVELMQFEETDESLLSTIRKINRLDDGFVFHTDKKIGADDHLSIYFFDENGKFQKKINRQGQGPEEYSSIEDLWIENGLVAVYSMPKSVIYRYTTEGEFIDSHKLPDQLRVGGIQPYKGGGYVAEMNYLPINDTSYYKFAKLDKDLKVENPFLKYSKAPDGMMMPINYSTVIPYQDGAQLFRVFSDTVYAYVNDEFAPLAYFNFKEDWFWRDKPEPTSNDLQKVEAENKAWVIGMSIGQKYIYADALIGYSHWEYFLINRMSGKVKRMGMPKGKSVREEFYYLGWEEDRLMFSITTVDVPDILSALDESQINYREGTTLEKIESSENPLVMWVKFENFK
ncbi:6-bladed beta-propeller [uncultured Roseivirga sp.]|uniref:6-bladed beta-propeller n=1 Tax=uncultured Roseivirga sp. TaxID=543088 RepID=UPI0030DA0B25|tara:strand:- start:66 stop:1244 length:1179 start_codon:yes stop_codon:yes gene_type:complete